MPLCLFRLLVAGLLSTIGALAQCAWDNTTMWVGYNYPVTRLDGNHVRLYAETVPTGNYRGVVQAYIQTWLYKDNLLLDSSPAWTPGPGGSTASKTWTPTLQVYGPGQYSMTALHTGKNLCTNEWMPCAQNCTNGQGYSWPQPLQVTRPATPDYAPGSQRALWYLGNVPFTGAYTSEASLTAGSANGAPETPNWVFKSGSGKGWLTCTNCTSPVFRATNSSSGCQVYDVVIVTTYNGFESDPFYMFINRPHNTVAANDPVTLDYWKADADYLNGWETRFNYKTMGLCATDDPMSGYDMNEQFGSWTDDYYAATGTSNSWTPPDCAVNPQSYTCGFTAGSGWQDIMRFACPAQNCTPSPQNHGTGNTRVQSAQQTWRVGGGSPGVGTAVQINKHQRYRDHGGHENIVNPAIP